MHHAFLYISLQLLHDYDVKTSDDEIFFLFLNLSAVPRKSTPGIFANIRHFQRIQRIGINATKFEKTQIHFKSDVFAAVAVVDAKTPY